MKYFILTLLSLIIISCTKEGNKPIIDNEVRDVTWFLKRMRTVDHLPILENSHTAMVSTWDTTGANLDAFLPAEETDKTSKTVLNLDGPGCIHRMFTGFIDERFDNTRIQIYIDHSETPLFDMPITKFFDDKYSPFPYPLTFVKSYPGTLMPIPFEKNITIKIVTAPYNKNDWINGPHSEAEWILGRWGVYWQFTYTTYNEDVKVKSLDWPLNPDEKKELDETVNAWLKAESTAPQTPEKWTLKKSTSLKPRESLAVNINNTGVIEQMRIVAFPDSPEVLNNLRLKIYWDGYKLPSVDVPVGYMFGHGVSGHNVNDSSVAAVLGKKPVSEDFIQTETQKYNTNYYSLLMGMTDEEVYSKFPMPFSNGARIELVNTGNAIAEKVEIKLDIKKMHKIPENWGRFNVTWSQELAGTEASPKFGKLDIPGKMFLNRRGKGKYVGSMLQLAWDSEDWWGEGDWLIWTDESEWPPSYHGTGSEEYFNSGWCMFDRKAVSGFVSLRPGYPTVYSFHLNDAFNFQENITVFEEQWALEHGSISPNKIMATLNPIWSSTAFWYSAVPTGAESMQ